MKLNGVSVPQVTPVPFQFHRQGQTFTLWCHPVLQFDGFELLCPEPQPPTILRVGEKTPRPDFKDRGYVAEHKAWLEKRTTWMFLTSLAPNKVEYNRVRLDDPDTWVHFEEDLEAALTPFEIQKLIQCIVDAHKPTAETYREAIDVFPASQAPAELQDNMDHSEQATT